MSLHPFVPGGGYERIYHELQERVRYRADGRFNLADVIRADLVDQGWKIEDGAHIGERVDQLWLGTELQELVCTDGCVARRARKLQ